MKGRLWWFIQDNSDGSYSPLFFKSREEAEGEEEVQLETLGYTVCESVGTSIVDVEPLWYVTTEDRPKEGEYWCLHSGYVKQLTYNSEYGYWDDASGDDYFCDYYDVTHYTEFFRPEKPF